MKNIYTILGLGLLSAAALNSCQQEDIYKDGGDRSKVEGMLSTMASIKAYVSDNEGSRANVQEDGKTFYWNTGDKVTIWDGSKAVELAATNYEDKDPSSNVEFIGTGELTDGATVWGIYPSKNLEEVTAENVFVFSLPDEMVQQGDNQPHLQNTMFMMAEGKVNGQTVTNLTFKHLTSLLHFSLQNNTSDTYTIKAVEVQAYEADGATAKEVFPKKLQVKGDEKIYSEPVNVLSLKFDNRQLSHNGKLAGYLSFFPSQGLTSDSKLKIIAKVQKNSEAESELVLKEGTVGELYKDKALTLTDNFNYVAGKRYGVTSAIVNSEDLGYTGENDTYTILTAQGFVNAISNGLFNGTNTISLQDDIDMSTVADASITPIADFKGTLDGKSHTISNLSLESASLFTKNSGTIKNLTFDKLTIKSQDGQENVGLVGVNNGTIDGVKISAITLTVTGKYVGGLVGTNTKVIQNSAVESGKMNVILTAKADAAAALVGCHQSNGALIQDCYVGSPSNGDELLLTIDGSKLEVYSGSLVGFTPNAGSKPVIKGCGVYGTVTLKATNIANTSNTGGLIGWYASGDIIGCYSLALVKAEQGNMGGLIGQAQTPNAKQVMLCYSAGSVEKIGTGAANVAGLVGKTYNPSVTFISCYTTTTLIQGASAVQANMGGSSPVYQSCYYTQEVSSAAPDAIKNSLSKKTPAELRNLVATLNGAVSSQSEYQFKANEGSDTEPLIIEKKN